MNQAPILFNNNPVRVRQGENRAKKTDYRPKFKRNNTDIQPQGTQAKKDV